MTLPTKIKTEIELRKEKNSFKYLPENYKTWIEPRLERPFKALSESEAEIKCLEIITVAHSDYTNGNKTNSSILQTQAQILLQEICQHKPFKLSKSKFLTLTPSEVQKALRLTVRGEFGQIYGMNAKTYYQAINGYLLHAERQMANLEYFKLLELEEKPKELTKEEIMQIEKDGVIRLFESYKNGERDSLTGSTLPHPTLSAAFYRSLCTLLDVKTLVEDKQTRKQIKDKSIDLYVNNCNKVKDEAKLKGDLKTSKGIDEILKGDLSKNPSLANVQKKVALKWYFDDLIKNNKTLEL